MHRKPNQSRGERKPWKPLSATDAAAMRAAAVNAGLVLVLWSDCWRKRRHPKPILNHQSLEQMQADLAWLVEMLHQCSRN
jgi:hypothetical protein